MGFLSNLTGGGNHSGRDARQEADELTAKHQGFENNRQTQLMRMLYSTDLSGIEGSVPDVTFGTDQNAEDRADVRFQDYRYAHTAATIAPKWRESGNIPGWIDRQYIDNKWLGSEEQVQDNLAEAEAEDAAAKRQEAIWRAYLPKSHHGHQALETGQELTWDEVQGYEEGDKLYEEVWSLWYRTGGREDSPYGNWYNQHFDQDWDNRQGSHEFNY